MLQGSPHNHKMNEENKKKFDEFMNEQFRILQGHHSRCMLRIYNKMTELQKQK